MKMVQEITYDQIKIDYDFNKILGMSLEQTKLFPGNQEFMKMLETILKIDGHQHIFISSSKSSKVDGFLMEFLKDKCHSVSDWCYVHNFENPNSPSLIQLEGGKGAEFKKQLETSVSNVMEECKEYFVSKELKAIEKALKEEVLATTEKELEGLKGEAKSLGFSTHISEKGVFFIPVINGKKISESEYDNLNSEEQEVIIKDLDILEKMSKQVMKKIKKIKKESQKKVTFLKKRIIEELIDKNMKEVSENFCRNATVNEYIIGLKKDLDVQIKRIFLEIDREQIEKIKELLHFEKIESENKNRYIVNYLEKKSAFQSPIIYASKVTYYELFGKIEFLNEAGVFVTDFTGIKPGLIHQANGGYLILDIHDVISSKLIWDKLKKALVEKSIGFDNIREQMGALPVKNICPQEMPMDIKVILIGEEQIYEALYEIDPEFKEIFSYHLVLPGVVDSNQENMAAFVAYLKSTPLTEGAIKRLLEYCIKRTGNKKKLSNDLTELDKIIRMSHHFAKEKGQQMITEEEIVKSEEELDTYKLYHKKTIEELIAKGQILIETTGKKTGQINALSISSYTDHDIAYPIRITASTYLGDEGIISIEKENKMSGKIFGKGISIISSYLYNIFSKDKPMSINCLLCFEQMYGNIEGDSASSAEIYAVLSALSHIPIDQGIGITGSVDQFGNVQPIGSVSMKVEGFYNICKMKGLTGKQGVIIPSSNLEELILPNEILEAIKNKGFHIYTINKIEEGIGILMNTTFDKVKKAANFSIK